MNIKSYSCPNCGETINIRICSDIDEQDFTCPYCLSTLTYKKEEYKNGVCSTSILMFIIASIFIGVFTVTIQPKKENIIVGTHPGHGLKIEQNRMLSNMSLEQAEANEKQIREEIGSSMGNQYDPSIEYTNSQKYKLEERLDEAERIKNVVAQKELQKIEQDENSYKSRNSSYVGYKKTGSAYIAGYGEVTYYKSKDSLYCEGFDGRPIFWVQSE